MKVSKKQKMEMRACAKIINNFFAEMVDLEKTKFLKGEVVKLPKDFWRIKLK